jgi:hypothetical protein
MRWIGPKCSIILSSTSGKTTESLQFCWAVHCKTNFVYINVFTFAAYC